jgi:vacuolar-type H+-ATPase subunit E/Vma4
MSSQPTDVAKQTLKSVKEMLEKAEATTHKALSKAAPAVQRSLDVSIEAASKGFAATMKSIDGATASDQAKLLRAYKKFLAGQVDFVESRIRDLEAKSQPKK